MSEKDQEIPTFREWLDDKFDVEFGRRITWELSEKRVELLEQYVHEMLKRERKQ